MAVKVAPSIIKEGFREEERPEHANIFHVKDEELPKVVAEMNENFKKSARKRRPLKKGAHTIPRY